MVDLISSHIDVSPNEYVTKYSFNRNFQKLAENDFRLFLETQKHIDYNTVNAYIDGKPYYRGECIFYKTSNKSMNVYALSCITDVTVNAPSCIYDSVGNLVVVNNDKWKIIGIHDELSSSPVDYANEYVKHANLELDSHASDTSLSAHPTKKLGVNDSSIVFRSFENADEKRKTFFYPNHIQTLQPDDTIINGYMRRWECGLLEYDVIFRVGYFGDTSDDGVKVISANCLYPTKGNQNQFYFKNIEDYNIFNQKTDNYAVTDDTKQVNLNDTLNAYHGEIKFPQEFKDLNYMMFASDLKSVETEAAHLVDEKQNYPAYDDRLVITHLAVVDHQEDVEYKQPIKIPDWVETIDDFALASIKETNSTLPTIVFGPNSKLIDVRDSAFKGTAFKHIEFPRSTRCIGMQALAKCENLETVDLWVNVDKSKQLVLDYNVFANDPKLSAINLHYFTELIPDVAMFAVASTTQQGSDTRISTYTNVEDLSVKLTDPSIRRVYGISRDIVVSVDTSHLPPPTARKAYMTAQANQLDGELYTSVTVSSLLDDLQKELHLHDDQIRQMHLGVETGFDCPADITCISYSGKESIASLNIMSSNTIAAVGLVGPYASMSVDISGVYFDVSSLYCLSCDTLNIINLEKANLVHGLVDDREITLLGFAPSAFANCCINKVIFNGAENEKLIKMALQVNHADNVLGLNDQCIVNAGGKRYVVNDGHLIELSVPSQIVVDDNCTVVSCSCQLPELTIPYGVRSIGPYAFAGSCVSAVNIPSTVLSIEDNAFNQMPNLVKIDFDAGTRLQSIGNELFDSTCSNLVEFKLY